MSQSDEELRQLMRILSHGIKSNPLNNNQDYLYWIVRFCEEFMDTGELKYDDIVEMLESERDYHA